MADHDKRCENLTPKKIAINFGNYIKNRTDQRPPSKYDFADYMEFPNWEYMKDAVLKLGTDGEKALASIDNTIARWLIEWVMRAEDKLELAKREKVCELLGYDKSNPTPVVQVANITADTKTAQRIAELMNAKNLIELESKEGKEK